MNSAAIRSRAFAGLVLGLVCACICSAALVAADLPRIPADQMKPGAQITLDLPIELGHSSRRAYNGEPNKPIQMYVILPSNYKADKPMPVIVHCGGMAGSINEIDAWSRCIEGKNFILISVDYNVDTDKARDTKFKDAIYGLEMLKRSTAVDTSSVFLTGFSSGAYGICEWLGIPEAKVFCGFVVMCGGDGNLKAGDLNGRPILFVAGETDTAKASMGMARVDAEKKIHAGLTKAGADSELFIQPGAGHEWKAETDSTLRDWLYRKLPSPEFHRMQLYAKLAGLTQIAWRQDYYKQKLAEYWLVIPGAAK